MTRLLLDTHVFLWAIAEPKRLSSKARSAIAKLENQVHVSSFARQVAHLYASELHISVSHTLTAGQLDWAHKDPFDRTLVAQAMVEGLTLVTADEDLQGFQPVATLW